MKKIILFFLLAVTGFSAIADSIPKFRVSFEPQYFVINTFKPSFDICLGGDEWLILSPSVTMREKEIPYEGIWFGSDHFLRAWGAGLGLAYRKYLNKPEDMARYFFTFRLGYHYYEPVYYRYMWTDYEEDGITYTTYKPGEDKRSIHQPRGEIMMGTLFRVCNGMFFEIGAGGGIKHSFMDRYRGDPENLYAYYWSYGYSGTYFLLNVRLGVEF